MNVFFSFTYFFFQNNVWFQSPILSMTSTSACPTAGSWRSSWRRVRRSWSSPQLMILARPICTGRRAEPGQKSTPLCSGWGHDGHGGKLWGWFQCCWCPWLCFFLSYRLIKGRVSGSGSDRRWYIDKVTKVYLFKVWTNAYIWRHFPSKHCL